MSKPFYLLAGVLTASLVCSVAGAQMRGGGSVRMPSARVAVAPSVRVSGAGPRAIPGAVRQGCLLQISPSGRVNPGFSSFANSVSTNGVPGLGFDYPHLAAISGGLRNGRTSNSLRGIRRRQGNLIPIFVGGYPYYDYGDSSDYEQPEQPPQAIYPQPLPAPPVDSVNYSAPPPALSPAAPVPDVGEFVLVRRDGRVLFASAFSVGETQVTYVTPEGIRRTLPLAELDADATQQMNEARGTTVQIHN